MLGHLSSASKLAEPFDSGSLNGDLQTMTPLELLVGCSDGNVIAYTVAW